MKFIIKDAEGKECGPYELKEIEQFILEGKVDGTTPIRTALLAKWNRIDKLEQLAESLAVAQANQAAQAEANSSKLSGLFHSSHKPAPKNKDEEVDTTFRNRAIPVPAGGVIRLISALTDAILLAAFVGILLLAGLGEIYLSASHNTTQAAPEVQAAAKKEATTPEQSPPAVNPEVPKTPTDNLTATVLPNNNDDNSKGYLFGSVWEVPATGVRLVCISATPGKARWALAATIHSAIKRTFVLFIIGFLLYYGLCLGLAAQTAGMWFWGLFIVKKIDGDEVYLFRAFVFTLLMLVFGLLTPILALLPGHWAIHDLLAGVRVQRTVPRSRY